MWTTSFSANDHLDAHKLIHVRLKKYGLVGNATALFRLRSESKIRGSRPLLNVNLSFTGVLFVNGN